MTNFIKIYKKIFCGNSYHMLEKHFIKLNRKEWTQENKLEMSRGHILVYVRDGFPRKIIEAMLLAKHLEEKEKKDIIVVLDGIRKSSSNKSKIYESFNIKSVYFTYGFNIIQYIVSFFRAVYIFLNIRNGKDLLGIVYRDMKIGEEIYDTILRWDKSLYTVDKIKIEYFIHIYKMIYFLDRYKEFFSKSKIDIIIFSDLDYVPRNSLEKIGIKNGCKFYHSNTGRYRKYENIQSYKLENPIKTTNTEIETMLNRKDIIIRADNYIKKRFKGEALFQYDAIAFLKKKIYTKRELYESVGVSSNNLKRKAVCVAAHAFSDRVHYGFNMIYQDYYCWLVETLKILNRNENVDVWVKEHPSFALYNEDGMIKKILKQENLEHIYLIPDDFSTASIKNIFNYVVTCQGTIGLEMACFGIPVFTASQGYYYGQGIDINSTTIEEYSDKLSHIEKYEKLNEECIKKAKILLYIQWGYTGETLRVPSVFPKDLFSGMDGVSYEKYWVRSYNQYLAINLLMENGAKMKDLYYKNIEDLIV